MLSFRVSYSLINCSESAAVLTDSDESVGDGLGLGVAHVGKLADVLEGVGTEGTAKILDAANHNSEAVEVLRDLGCVSDILEVGGEKSINELTVLELSLEVSIGLWGALRDDSLVEEVQVVVTRVNNFGSLALSVDEGLLIVVLGLSEESLGQGSITRTGALEVTNWLSHESEVAEFHDWGLGSLSLDGIKLLLEGLGADIVGLSVLHPVDREEITKA